MSDELPDNLRPVADFFGLPSTATVTKDFYVVRAIKAVASVDASPFTLVFGGGTALARAHRLVKRMSEDVDFKIVPPPGVSIGPSKRRKLLGVLRKRVNDALHAAGFAFDPADETTTWSRDANTYSVWHLPYEGRGDDNSALRPTIQVEMTHASLRLAAVDKPVSSFVAEAFSRPPEVASIPCVSLTETAAEKFVSLTRRTAMERAGLSRAPDPTLVRHIYDLHAMRENIDIEQLARLVPLIAATDAEEFGNQYPAYAADIMGETRSAIIALQSDDLYRQRYNNFTAAMVYGDHTDFRLAIGTVLRFAETVFENTPTHSSKS